MNLILNYICFMFFGFAFGILATRILDDYMEGKNE